MSAPEFRSRRPLDVYLGSERIGSLEDRGMGFVALDFDESAVLRYGVGSRIVSIALPVGWDTTDPLIATPFFAGLLPEGRARDRLCQEFRLSPNDPFALLTVLGPESVGALVIVPEGSATPPEDGAERVLDAEGLTAELDRLDIAPLGVTPTGAVRLSMAGVQQKLLLVRNSTGQLALPLHGRPSTHIAKPGNDDPRFPHIVENEAFCLDICRRLGVETTRFEVITPAARPVLLIERYDRTVGRDGRVERIHQEDACQATATYPQFKYEQEGGPALATVAGLLSEHASRPALDRLALFRLAVVNLLLGNCDAHGKNVSFLHDAGGVRLAPAYDIVSTEAYDEHTDVLGMRVGHVEHLRGVNRDAVLREAHAMRVPPGLAVRTLNDVERRLGPAIDQALSASREGGWFDPIIDRIAEGTRTRAARILG